MAKAKKKFASDYEVFELISQLHGFAREYNIPVFTFNLMRLVNIISGIQLDSDTYNYNQIDINCRRLLINTNDDSKVRMLVKQIRAIYKNK